MRDSDRARMALMLVSWQIQQADGLCIAMAHMEKATGRDTEDPAWKGLGSDRWEVVLKRTADGLVALAAENADWFSNADAVDWADEPGRQGLAQVHALGLGADVGMRRRHAHASMLLSARPACQQR
jgi:hypothetical protein